MLVVVMTVLDRHAPTGGEDPDPEGIAVARQEVVVMTVVEPGVVVRLSEKEVVTELVVIVSVVVSVGDDEQEAIVFGDLLVA